jgi:hypothetical protein
MSTFSDEFGRKSATILAWVLIILLLWMALVFMPDWVQKDIERLVDKMTSEKIK